MKTPKKITVLPCKHCGHSADIVYYDAKDKYNYNLCLFACMNKKCKVRTETGVFVNPRFAAKQWNKMMKEKT